jgi:hopene-associated glycosyltransferase HpnB
VLGLGIVCVISAAAWLYLVAAHGGFWLTSQRLPPDGEPGARPGRRGKSGATRSLAAKRSAALAGNPGDNGEPGAAAGLTAWPGVAAVVPARNEAESLPVILPALLAQEYPGDFRVYLVDDNSDDGTGAIAAELGEKSSRDGGAPLTVVRGQPRPDGWAGKVWAMAQGFAAATATAGEALEVNGAAGSGRAGEAAGVSEAGRAVGADRAAGADWPAGTVAAARPDATPAVGAPPQYVLFTDADISWAPRALLGLVASAGADDRALVSQMALLRAETRWERVIVPAFVYFFAQLYPFRKVNDPKSGTAAAAGGCMLVRRAALDKAGGLEQIKGALIDDVALGTLLKRHGNRIWLGLTTDVRSARPYPGLASLWQMIARSAYVQLRYNPLLLAGTIIGLLVLYVAPPAGAIAALVAAAAGVAGPPEAIAGLAGLADWALMTASYVPMLRLYRLSALRAPTLPLIAALYAAMTADSARRHYSGRAVPWRGARV